MQDTGYRKQREKMPNYVYCREGVLWTVKFILKFVRYWSLFLYRNTYVIFSFTERAENKSFHLNFWKSSWKKNIRNFRKLHLPSAALCSNCTLGFRQFEHYLKDKHTKFSVVPFNDERLRDERSMDESWRGGWKINGWKLKGGMKDLGRGRG